MLKTLICFVPFAVCLFWFAAFAACYRKSDAAKRALTWFLATCVVLYFNHGLFFTVGIPQKTECVWAFCSLSVYPLYFIYICALVGRPLKAWHKLLLLLPAALVAAAMLLTDGPGPEMARKVISLIQIPLVCYFGFRRLQAFDAKLADIYADTEEHSTGEIKGLLLAFFLISVLSIVASVLGRQFFAETDWPYLVTTALPFSVLLYVLGFIGFVRPHTSLQDEAQGVMGNGSWVMSNGSCVTEEGLGQKIEALMSEEHLFLMKGLKIDDVASRTGSCRTYISNYINQTHGCSFSDYINRQRIAYAKTLMQRDAGAKMLSVAMDSGFSSEQSFYRNFQKFEGIKPAQWQKQQ